MASICPDLYIRRTDAQLEKGKSRLLAFRRTMDEIEKKGEHLTQNYTRDYLSDLDFPSENEIDPKKLEIISKVLERKYPSIHQGFGSLKPDFKFDLYYLVD
jgi:hypothetical protein